jgi:CBS domain-containing protein
MRVKDVMSREPVSVLEEETLSGLVAKFIEHNYHTFPVIDEVGVVVGTVDYEDIMKIFVPHSPSLEKLLKSTHFYNVEEEDILEADLPPELGEKVTVADIMDRDVVTVDEDMTLAEARRVMKQHNTERIPVTSGDRLAGFITLFDIIVFVLRRKEVIR